MNKELKDTLTALTDSYELEIRYLDEAVQRVRDLHIPNPRYVGEHIPCVVCKETIPCPTIKALNGEQ